MRGSRRGVLLAIGLIGVILSGVLLFPGAWAAFSPSLPEKEGGVSVNASSPGLVPGNDTALLAEPLSDDDRLESLIAGASIPLLEVSVEQICSLYDRDDAGLQSRAATMSSLADGYRAEAAALEVSPDMASAYAQFFVALDEYAAAATLLNGSTPLNRSVTDDALDHLALGAEHLSEALQECNRSPAGNPDAPTVPMNLTGEPALLFPGALQVGERFRYDDARGENTASLIVSSVTSVGTFQTSGTKPTLYTAAPGNSFLLVAVKASHLGHKGEGANTRFQTPRESAFTLHYAAETYRPLKAPGPTLRGGSYSGVLLDRHESVEGFLFFEVPEGLDPSHAYLEAGIGKESPVWVLGRAP